MRTLDVSDSPDQSIPGLVEQILDPSVYRSDAAFNIPNDADDTSMIVAVQKFHSRFHPDDPIEPDLSALNVITRFFDRDRSKTDPRDHWRGEQETGVFLTWLKDENLETFSSPKAGIMTHGVNKVDCVVNANVLFSFALNGVRSWEGFEEAKLLLIRTIREGLGSGRSAASTIHSS